MPISIQVLGEIFYPLSFLHSTGFFLTLYRAAYMTSMVSRNTRSPYFHLLHDWLVTHYPDGWKNSQWKPGMSKGAMKSLLLRDIQILRAFSGYFYYTGLGLDVMDLEQAERLFAGELNALVLHGDIFGHSGMASTAGEEVSALDSPVKASRLSTVNRGGISCHDLSLLSLIGCLVPPALPVIVVLRMILKLAFKQIKAMGVTSIDTMEAKRECMQRASQLEMRRTSEIEEAVVESSLPMAQKATYQKLEILAIELLSRVQVQTTAYEALLAQRYALKRLENVAEEELALGIERSPPVVPQAVIVPDSITVGGEPFIRHGDAMSLELPYSTIQRLESILCEIKDLSHAIARGTKTLCTMVSVRFQSLLEALAEVVTVVKFHRRRADDWADQQRHSVDHHTLVASNRRSIIGNFLFTYP